MLAQHAQGPQSPQDQQRGRHRENQAQSRKRKRGIHRATLVVGQLSRDLVAAATQVALEPMECGKKICEAAFGLVASILADRRIAGAQAGSHCHDTRLHAHNFPTVVVELAAPPGIGFGAKVLVDGSKSITQVLPRRGYAILRHHPARQTARHSGTVVGTRTREVL